MVTEEKSISFSEQRELYIQEIYPIAPKLRRKIISDNEVIKDSFERLEQLGIFLLRFPGEIGISGFHIKKSGIDCIYINSSVSLGRQYFSCWHEYYHAVTGEGSGASLFREQSKDIIECKANLFAGYVLMPENLVERYIEEHNIDIKNLIFEDIINMQQYFNVSYKAVIKRLKIIYGFINNESTLYSLSTKEEPRKLTNYIKGMGYSTRLSNATNDIYIPQSFFNNIDENFKNKRINEGKKKSIEDFLKLIKYEL